jgi:hypothetical protein
MHPFRGLAGFGRKVTASHLNPHRLTLARADSTVPKKNSVLATITVVLARYRKVLLIVLHLHAIKRSHRFIGDINPPLPCE